MIKIVIIGAGSFFGQKLVKDILSFPEFQDSKIWLVDINPDHLIPVEKYCKKVVELHGCSAVIKATTERKDALPEADYVITSISQGGPAYSGEPYYYDITIPCKYGVDQFVADTVGIGGIFRTMRTAPEMLNICKDMEKYCPEAWLLNYVNPMSMLTRIMYDGSLIKNIGLCHSVQGTARQLADYIGAKYEDISYWVAGINHIAWFLTFKYKGKDAYPLLWEAMKNNDIYWQDQIKFEIFKYFGYFVTESSAHMSEYVPYFRKNDQLIDKFKLERRNVCKNPETNRWEANDSDLKKELTGDLKIDLTKSHEYASEVIYSLETGEPARMNLNVKNNGVISNLSSEGCVEVPCLVDELGVHPCYVGKLPTELAAIDRAAMDMQNLTVEAFFEKSVKKATRAAMLDPLTAACCTLKEIQKMFDEIFTAEEKWLSYWKKE